MLFMISCETFRFVSIIFVTYNVVSSFFRKRLKFACNLTCYFLLIPKQNIFPMSERSQHPDLIIHTSAQSVTKLKVFIRR